MISSLITLTNQWQQILNNETGTLTHEEGGAVAIRVGAGDEVLLPSLGFNFQESATVEAKQYNSEPAKIGVIK